MMSNRWFWSVAGGFPAATGVRDEHCHGRAGRIGRYQLARVADQVMMWLDTATGEKRAYHVGRHSEGVSRDHRNRPHDEGMTPRFSGGRVGRREEST